MKMDVAGVMQRIREEVARRQDHSGGAEGLETTQAPQMLPRWSPALPPVSMKPEYTAGELLVHSDQAFIEFCYFAVLRRPADPEGLATYLRKLRSGELSKVEVLAQLRWSPEGQARGVHVDGLLVPAKLHQWRRKRFVGTLIKWAHAIFRLPTLNERASYSEAVQAHEIQKLGQLVNRVSAQVDLRLGTAEKARAAIADRLRVVEDENLKQAQQLQETLAAMADRLRTIEDENFTLAQRWQTSLDEALSKQSAAMEAQRVRIAAYEIANTEHQESLAAELGWQKDHLVAHGAALAQINRAEELDRERERALDPLYVAFEERFRGSRELIRERSLPYVDIVRTAGAGTHEAPVLDIGCGRGDWLDILREHSLIARGVDSNRVFVDICRGRGLEVIEGDVLEILRRLDDMSVGAITGMHIAEHLPFETLVALLDEAKRVLRIGGVLALETPNPENLWVASHWFYIDPTHRNPLPPETLRWIVEARGFSEVRIERWTVARELPAPPLLDAEAVGAASVNVLLEQLHAAPDYAIIARRIQ